MREWAASELGRCQVVTLQDVDVDPTLLNVPDLTDVVEDSDRLVDSYVEWLDDFTDSANPVSYWRRITATATTVTPPQISINRAFDDVAPPEGTRLVLYSLLNPTEWNDAIDEALTRLYFVERETVALDDDNTEQEYTMSSWLQFKGQMINVLYRNTVTGVETAVPRFRLIEDRNALTLKLLDPQWPSSTYSLIVEANRFYSRLNADDWGTTCPSPLWQAAIKVAALHKIFSKYGVRFKAQFQQDLAIAEKELMKQRQAILPQLTARDYAHDDAWEGNDIDEFFLNSGWA